MNFDMRVMNNGLTAILAFAVVAFCGLDAVASATSARNLPAECKAPDSKCGCAEDGESGDGVSDDCIKVHVALGNTTPWSGSMPCSLKVFADNDSQMIFTADSLHAVLGGYTFKRLGPYNLSDGVTPSEVVLSHPNGEPIHFVFKDGESIARPDPGVHVKMDERLMMVDAEGWAVTRDPVYYDLYVGDGSRRRFLATNMTGQLGALVSITDPRGVTVTPSDMGVEIIYDSNGVRQFLTPSRLADITQHPGFTGYDVKVYAVSEPPVKDAATGLYALPNAVPVKTLSIRRENDGKRAVVTVRKGGGEARVNVFDYEFGDWSLTRPSSVREEKERFIADEREAHVVKEVRSSLGERLSRTETNYKWESWGFAMTNKVDGFGGVTDTTTWTYYTSGNGKGQVKSELRQSGLLTQYDYDAADRVISETRSGPDMMTETTTYDYTPVDASDPVLHVDTRPRTVVKALDGVECERTYYVYSPLTNIVERVGAQGAPYGSTNSLRTVTAYYPADEGNGGLVGGGHRAPRSGLVASIRHEDGRLDVYDYSLSSNLWTETVTHLHEQSPLPVSGKTTRDVTTTNARGEEIETRTEAFIDGVWHVIARNRMTYNAEGKRTSLENLAGQVTTTAWDCCHKVSETQPDGSTTTWDYDDEGRMIALSRLIPLDMTNVTWLTTCYEYDDLGRQTATWQTNFAAQVGLPVQATKYDQQGRILEYTDDLGNAIHVSYSNDGLIRTERRSDGGYKILARNPQGDALSLTGNLLLNEVVSRGVLPNGTCWERHDFGDDESGYKWTTRHVNMLKQETLKEKSAFGGSEVKTYISYTNYDKIERIAANGKPIENYVYSATGEMLSKTISVDGIWNCQWVSNTYFLCGNSVKRRFIESTTCSDQGIAPVTKMTEKMISGLDADCFMHTDAFDGAGNVTTSELRYQADIAVELTHYPFQDDSDVRMSRFGISMKEYSASGVGNERQYDWLGRVKCITDSRGIGRVYGYNNLGLVTNIVIGNRTTSYCYDKYGHVVQESSSTGKRKQYEYDIAGRKVFEHGGLWPIRFTYDAFGNMISMTTYTNQTCGVSATTRWLYDASSGMVTNKVYANGSVESYLYDINNRMTERMSARGIVTTYSYDGWGRKISVLYSDETPSVTIQYDAMGREIASSDAGGTTTILYDSLGNITNEVTVGVAGTNSLAYYFDDFGRDVGYSLNGTRQTELVYEQDKGRISLMKVYGMDKAFRWHYVEGSNLKKSLEYPNGDIVTWCYEDYSDNIIVVSNSNHSIYCYSYDGDGKRSKVNDDQYSYDEYGNLTFVSNQTSNVTSSYSYDSFGNRIASNEAGAETQCYYNCQNEMLSINSEIVSYDLDGNQTTVVNETGHWNVRYDAENRPTKWCRIEDGKEIQMIFDRFGRRVLYGNKIGIYKGYLNVADAIWDPTEKYSTKPLVANFDGEIQYYFCDGNGNVSDFVGNMLEEHYTYTPFGLPTNLSEGNQCENRILFSSEFFDAEIGSIYYNFRHYSPSLGRWMQRDPGGEDVSKALYVFVGNDPVGRRDFLGMDDCWTEANAVAGISFSINVGLGELTGSFGGNRSTVRCNKDCSKCKKGYTIETTTSWGGGTGGSWKWVTPIGIPIDVGFSWELDKSQWYFYDSCINREDSKSCATISVSIFAGKCFGIGSWIRHCFNIDGTYVYSDCGNGQNNFSIGVTWTQCYGPERFGGCISTRYSPDWLKFGKY